MHFHTNIRQWGDNLLYVGYANGNRIVKKIAFEPTLYTVSQTGEPTNFKSYDGQYLEPIECSSIKDAKEFIDRYKGVQGFQVFGMDKFPYEAIAKAHKGEIEYKFSMLRLFYLDIEVFSGEGFPEPNEARFPVTAVTIYDSKTGKSYVWGEANGPGGKFTTTDPNVVYKEFDRELDLLFDVVQFWEANCPDVVTGWNSREFDIPYLFNRITKLLGKNICNRFSPFGMVKEKMVTIKRFSTYQEVQTYDIYGVNEIDYLDLYKKYIPVQKESYKLGFIGQVELNETKVEFDGSLHQLYTTDYQKYIDYNLQDVALLVKLEAKLKYLELLVEVSYAGKVATYNDSLGTVKYWEILIYHHLYEQGIIPPIKENATDKSAQFAGAYVKPPVPGKYRWIMSYDIASLYPSAIRQVNIGPETLVPIETVPDELRHLLSQVTPEKLINKELDLSLLKKYDYSLSGNAKLYYKTKQSFFSEIMQKIFDKRIIYKKKMTEAKKAYEATHDNVQKELKEAYHIKQYAMKILANSGYGAIGNAYFQYFSVDNAEAVTLTGQVIIQWIEKRLNAYLNNLLKTNVDRIVAIDTDSNYIDMSDLVKAVFGDKQDDTAKIVEFLDKASREKIEPYIAKCFAELFDYLNNYTNNISMVRDVISDNAFWTAKKRYFMDVWDSEGVRYSEPDMKVMGIEVVKSSTPGICRTHLKEALQIVLRKNEADLQAYVKAFKKEYKKLPPDVIGAPRTINEITKFVDANGKFTEKTIPFHVRASVSYNSLLAKHNLELRYDTIKDGNKIKYVFLREPNTLGDDIIAFTDKLPKEFDIERYIDYDKQFEKTFLSPLKIITDHNGWNLEKQASLEDLFG